MNDLVFGAVADDDTGASDLGGMLAEQGVRTLLVVDLPPAERFREWTTGYQAVVVAVGTRNLPPAEAAERTRAALRLLVTRSPRAVQIKYCSTFDSTVEGNIGPSIDAALGELGEDFTVAVPALPVNGRTTYQGYHFVGRRLLSASPMRDHPLTPMTDPDLVRHLGRQTRRRVGLAALDAVEAGPDRLRGRFAELRREGVGVAVVDCLTDAHLRTVCLAVADLKLVTGSSAFGMHLPAVWRDRGWLRTDGAPPPAPVGGSAGCLVVAGSCSVATLGQNEWFAAQGLPVVPIDARGLLAADSDRSAAVGRARRELAAGRPCLLTTSATPDGVRRVQDWAAGRGLSVPALGAALARGLAAVAADAIDGLPVGGLIVAGGETSGAVCRRLGIEALRVGRGIEPGVPLCVAVGRDLPVVLKSGNLGSPDFYGRALRAVADPAAFFSGGPP